VPVGEVIDELDRATAAGVVVSRQPNTAEFVHALVRETLSSEVAPSRQLEVHGLVAAHLEENYADSLDRHAATLAHHLLSALPVTDAHHAVAWAERAAAQAMDALAYEEAARLYERALGAAESAGFGPRHRARLLSGRAEALYKCGDVTGAIAAAGEAGDDARRAGDVDGVVRAVLVLEGVADHAWASKAAALCEFALGELDSGEEQTASCLMSTLACQWSILASNYWDMEPKKLERADAKSREALELAERTGAPRALMGALRAREMVCAEPDRVQDRREVAERALRLAADTEDPWAEHWGRLWRIDASCQLGHLDAAEADLAALRVVVARLRQPVAQWHLARTGGAIAAARGAFAEAAVLLHEATELAGRGLDSRAVQMSAAAGTKLALLTGDAQYEPYVERLLHDSDPPSRPMVETYLTLLYATRGQHELAAEHYRRMPPWPNWRVPHFVELIATNEYARGTALMGDTEGALVAYERLLPWRSYFAVGGSGVVQIAGSVELALGCLAATNGRTDVAIRHLRAAIDANLRAGMPPFEAEARYELARVLSGLGDRHRSEALVLVTDAADAAARLGMQPLKERAELLVQSLRAEVGSRQGGLKLTRREEEIAGLVGKGLTNRQMAEVLHISERTAENHVQHILTKLGFRTRSQIAAWATASPEAARH
jgi:DNA-binding CsgD family transcriptional regulator